MYNVHTGCRVLLSLYVFAFFECTTYLPLYSFLCSGLQYSSFSFAAFYFSGFTVTYFQCLSTVFQLFTGTVKWPGRGDQSIDHKLLYTSADFKIFVKDPGPLPPVSTTPVVNFATIFPCVVDTGGKFATGVNDTGGKFAAGVNGTGGK